MSSNNTEEAKMKLLELYNSSTPFLEEYPWELEEDRWSELLVSVVIALGIDEDTSRRVVGILQDLGVTSAKSLENIDEDQKNFIRRIFLQSDVEEKVSAVATTLIINLAAIVNKKWDGFIQRFLREQGQRMVNELTQVLVETGIKTDAAKKTAVTWLQNVANIPILLPDDVHIQKFCKEFSLSEKSLLDVLDELGLNASVTDDLLNMHYNASEEDS